MAYQMTLFPFLTFVGAALALAFTLRRFSCSRTASSRVLRGVGGSGLGFLLAPLIATACDVIPSVVIQPRYFSEFFIGCIPPVAIASVYVSSALGVLLGFVAGCCLAPKLHETNIA